MISWKSKKQATISRSSTEAEYSGLSSSTGEIVWIQQLLLNLQVQLSQPALIFCENQAAIHIATNPIIHESTKHIEIDCHFIRDNINDGFIKLLEVQTQHQLADVFTKPLPASTLCPLLSKMAIIDLHSPS